MELRVLRYFLTVAQEENITRAAEALHIHKNTLQYRMRRLWEAVCPCVGGSFEREFLLRLCILYHRQLRLRTPLIQS